MFDLIKQCFVLIALVQRLDFIQESMKSFDYFDWRDSHERYAAARRRLRQVQAEMLMLQITRGIYTKKAFAAFGCTGHYDKMIDNVIDGVID